MTSSITISFLSNAAPQIEKTFLLTTQVGSHRENMRRGTVLLGLIAPGRGLAPTQCFLTRRLEELRVTGAGRRPTATIKIQSQHVQDVAVPAFSTQKVCHLSRPLNNKKLESFQRIVRLPARQTCNIHDTRAFLPLGAMVLCSELSKDALLKYE